MVRDARLRRAPHHEAGTTQSFSENPMNVNVPLPAGAVPWEQVRTRLDQNGPFANMYDTPLYRDAVWEQFSKEEYARRYAALRDKDYMQVNQYNDLRTGLPEAEIVFTRSLIHELVIIKSAEELDCVRKAGVLCERAMAAMVAAARPGATEADLRGAAGSAMLQGGGDIDFLIIGSTPMANPAMFFRNPRPSEPNLKTGDLVIMDPPPRFPPYTAHSPPH